METTFRLERDRLDRAIVFSGRITFADIEQIRLNYLDRALMNQENDPGDPLWSANNLLVLEMLFRRMAEQNTQKETPDLSDRG